jgi:hypothetical protein
VACAGGADWGGVAGSLGGGGAGGSGAGAGSVSPAASSSISKIRSLLGGITGGRPRSPYASW